MRASVVVVSWNGRELLQALLPELRAAVEPGGAEIVVVDNGSSDGSLEWIRREHAAVRLVASPTNVGFARGANLGAQAASGELLVLLNNDALPAPGWLAQITAPLEEGVADVVGGKILDAGGAHVDFGEGLLTFDGHAFQRASGTPVALDPFTTRRRSLFACGGNMALGRELFLELGGFDEDYFAYFEDVDLGWRANLWGKTVLLVPDAVVKHRGAGTSGRLDPFDRGFLFEVNAFQTAVKNLDDVQLRDYLPSILLTLLSRLQSLTVRLADGEGLLGSYPFSREGYRPTSAASGWLGRMLGGTAPTLELQHPHSLSYARSVEYILTHLDRILEKRQRVQARRVVDGADVLKLLEVAAVPTYPGDEQLFATAFFRYLLPADVRLRRLAEVQSSSAYS